MMAAGATKIDELKLSQDEAKQLAAAVAEVNSHYQVAIDPQVMAWISLATTATYIYAPRIAAYKIRISMENEKKKSIAKASDLPSPQENLQPEIEKLPMSVT